MRRAVVITVGAGLAAALLAAGAFALLVDAEALADRITPKASAVLNRPVDVRMAGLTLLPRPGVRLEDVRVGNLSGFEGPAIVVADRVDLSVALLPLARGRVQVSRASVRGLRVNVGIDEGGTSNFGDLVPSTDASPAGDPDDRIRVALRQIDLDDVSLSYFDVPRDRSMLSLGGQGELSIVPGADGAWQVELAGRSDSLLVRRGGETERIARLEGPRLRARLNGDATFGWVDVERGRLEHDAFSLAMDGRLEDLTTTRPRVDLRFENPALEASNLVALLPEHHRAELLPVARGTLDVGLSFEGPLGRAGPVLRGTIRLADLAVRLRGEPFVDSIRGMLRVGADSVRTDAVTGRFAGGRFDLAGAFSREDASGTTHVRAHPDLARLAALELGPARLGVTGDAVIEADVSGAVFPFRVDQVHGNVGLAGVRAEHPRLNVPIYVAAASVEVEGDRLSWPPTDFLAGEQQLTGAGELHADLEAWWRGEARADVDMTLSGSRLDLDEVLPGDRTPDLPSYPRIAFAHAGQRELDGRPAGVLAQARGFQRPSDLPLRGRIALDLDTLSWHDLVLDSVATRLALSDSILAVEDASFDVWGGRMTGSLHLGIWDALDAPFSVSLHGTEMQADQALQMLSPIGTAVRGTLDLDVDLVGSVDQQLLPLSRSLKGDVHIAVSEGSVSGTAMNLALADFLSAEEWDALEFTRWTSTLAVQGAELQVESSHLEGAFADVSSAGRVDLGGAVDLSMGLSIPSEQLHLLSLRRTGIAESVLAGLQSAGQPLVLGLRVGGFLGGPTLEPDALAVQEVVASR